MSFGRHQSFYLKDHWINKGIKAIQNINEHVIFDKKYYSKLGLGKNMHQSLRYWLEATNILEVNTQNKSHSFTDFGNLVKNNDPGCDMEITLLIIHYNLVRYNFEYDTADTFFWFFKQYNESVFTRDKAKKDISAIYPNVSQTTLGRDIDCLIQTYTNSQYKHPEDKNVSLLAKLGLLEKKDNIYVKTPLKKTAYSYPAFFYFLLKLHLETNDISLNNIVLNDNGLSKVFNLTRTDIIYIIEQLIHFKYPLKITRTNNLDTITFTSEINPEEFLHKAYQRKLIDYGIQN